MANTTQYTKGYTQRQFEITAAMVGWRTVGEHWIGQGAERVSNLGLTFIQRAPTQKAYYRVVQYTSLGGGEKHISPTLSRPELCAWFHGIQYYDSTLGKDEREALAVCRKSAAALATCGATAQKDSGATLIA